MSYPAAKHRAAGGPKKGYVKDTPIYRAAIDLLNFTLNSGLYRRSARNQGF